MKRILVSRTDRVGDLILSDPVFATLKDSYPDCHLSVLLSEKTKELLEHNPSVDEVIGYKPRDFFRLISELRKFEIAIILYPTFTIALVCWLSRIKLRVGTAYRFYSFFFNRKVREHRSDCKIHEAKYNVNLLKPLGITESSVTPRVWLSDADVEWAEQKLKELNAGTVLAAIHPGSGGSARRWGQRNFASLGDLLLGHGFEVLLTGGEGEEEMVERVSNSMKSPPVKIVGEAKLLQLAALFKKCRVLITNSTGPMHLAASCGVPVIGIFCPIAACSPQRWGPLGENTRVLIPEVPTCEKCVGSRCEYYDCMDEITADEVMEEVEKLIGNSVTQGE